jgi:hypothetical protein
MIAQRGPVIQPDPEDGLQTGVAELPRGKHSRSSERNTAQRAEQLHGHGAYGGEVAVARCNHRHRAEGRRS